MNKFTHTVKSVLSLCMLPLPGENIEAGFLKSDLHFSLVAARNEKLNIFEILQDILISRYFWINGTVTLLIYLCSILLYATHSCSKL